MAIRATLAAVLAVLAVATLAGADDAYVGVSDDGTTLRVDPPAGGAVLVDGVDCKTLEARLSALEKRYNALQGEVATLRQEAASNQTNKISTMQFGRACGGSTWYRDLNGITHTLRQEQMNNESQVMSSPAADGTQRLVYQRSGANGQPTFVFDISGAVSVACTIVAEENDFPDNWMWNVATDWGNHPNSQAVWGDNTTFTLFAATHSLACSDGQCSDDHPRALHSCSAYRIVCFE